MKDGAARFSRPVRSLTGEALRACVAHEWKGNVRELKSAVEQALLLAPGVELTATDLLGGDGVPTANVAESPLPAGSFRTAKEQAVANFERDFLLQALRRHAGNITRAAEEIGIYRQNFQQKMRELGITVDDAVGRSEMDE